MSTELVPLGDRLIVRATGVADVTASGLIIPEMAKEKPQRGIVLAVGDGRLLDTGQTAVPRLAAGDEVLYSKYGGVEVVIDGQDLLVLRESDVLAKVVTT